MYGMLYSGENSVHWRSGLSFEPYPVGFNAYLKRQILEIYGHKCFLCGAENSVDEGGKIKKLCVHHVDYVKEHLEKENLVPLCIPCNSKVNYDRDNWIKYFQERIAAFLCPVTLRVAG
jgi:predicted restriction endonuclease